MCIFSSYLFRWDFLNVYDGDYMDGIFSAQLGSLTGSNLPDNITSTGKDIYLNLISDETQNGMGFKIQFDAGKKNTPNTFLEKNVYLKIIYIYIYIYI